MKKLITIALLTLGCGTSDLDLQSPDKCQEKALYVDTNRIWPTNDVSICMNNADEVTEEQILWMKESLAETWEKHSPVRFTEWSTDCESGDFDLQVVFDDLPFSGTLGIGNALDGKAFMVLNVFHRKFPEILCGTERECAHITVVHEFGHILGFAHEHNRDDTPEWCKEKHEPQGSYGNLEIGGWDPYSVMNYCNHNWLGNGKLSCTDIAGVQALYGLPEERR